MKSPVGDIDPRHRTIHIWGGGVAGLLMAHFFSRAGYAIELYEKSERLGGKIQSTKLPDGVMESGPNAIYATAEIEAWLKTLELTPIPATPKLKRRLWNKRPLAPLPPLTALPLLTKIFKRTPEITDDITLADFFRPLLGAKIEGLLSPALQGIYACGADRLTVTSLWPDLKAGTYLGVLRQLKGPRARSVSFAGGMQEFIDALVKSIRGNVHLSYQGPFRLQPNTIICADALNASELVSDCWPTGAKELKELTYLPVSSTTVLSDPIPGTEKTFGYLFPREAGVNALGVLFNKEIFPHRVGMTFIHADAQRIDEKLTQDLKILGWSMRDMKTHSWVRGLPLYDKARKHRIEKLRADPTRPDSLGIFGNYIAGISLRDMIVLAKNHSQKYSLH